MNTLTLLALFACALAFTAAALFDDIVITVHGSVTGADAKNVNKILNQSKNLIQKTFKKLKKTSECTIQQRDTNPTIHCFVEAPVCGNLDHVVSAASEFKKTNKLITKGTNFADKVDGVTVSCNNQGTKYKKSDVLKYLSEHF